MKWLLVTALALVPFDVVALAVVLCLDDAGAAVLAGGAATLVGGVAALVGGVTLVRGLPPTLLGAGSKAILKHLFL